MTKSDISTANDEQRVVIKNACIKNAKWLLHQAKDNFQRQNFGLATFLAITAYEESLKFGLLNSNESKMLPDDEYNRIASHHNSKLLSKYAVIAIYYHDHEKTVQQKFTLPDKKFEYYKKEVDEIVDRRERSLYVDFNDSKINEPIKTNPAIAIEEINRANKSIESEITYEQVELLLRKKISEIKNK